MSTLIQWTDHSINPIRAEKDGRFGHHCVKVSPGCANCYSSTMQTRFGMPPFEVGKRVGVRHFLDQDRLSKVFLHRKPSKWFWCDMSDMFGDWVHDDWITACFAVMAATPHLTHQVLTKRPERMREWFRYIEQNRTGRGIGGTRLAPRGWLDDGTDALVSRPWPLPNVWVGCSVESQGYAEERIPILLDVPAAVRFLSCEPLLSPVDIRAYLPWRIVQRPGDSIDEGVVTIPALGGSRGVDWVIVGGESGTKARPFDLGWARFLVDQCRRAGVAPFVKQLGRRPVDGVAIKLRDTHGGTMDEWPDPSLRVREFPVTP